MEALAAAPLSQILWGFLIIVNVALAGVPRVSAGPHRPGHPLPCLLPLPQRHHLQPGDLRVRLVVSQASLSPAQHHFTSHCRRGNITLVEVEVMQPCLSLTITTISPQRFHKLSRLSHAKSDNAKQLGSWAGHCKLKVNIISHSLLHYFQSHFVVCL